MNMQHLSVKIVPQRRVLEFAVTVVLALLFVSVYGSSPVTICISAVAGVIVVPLMLKKPDVSIFCILPILLLRELHLVSALYVSRVVIWAVIGYLFIRQLTIPNKISFRPLAFFTKMVLLFWIALVISVIQAFAKRDNLYITSEDLKAIVAFGALIIVEQMFLVYILYYSIETLSQLTRLIDFMMGLSATVSLLGIWQYIRRGDTVPLTILYQKDQVFYGRAMSIFVSPNELAMFLAPMTLMAISLFLWGNQRFRRRFGFLLPVILVNSLTIFLSFSRSGIITWFVGGLLSTVLYYAMFCKRFPLWKMSVVMLLLTVIAGFGMRYYDVFLRMRFGVNDYREYVRAVQWTKEVSDYSRIDALQKAFPVILEHPFFGIGQRVFVDRYYASGFNPHNQYVTILIETGLFGFIPFMLLLGSILKKGLGLLRVQHTSPSCSQVKFLAMLFVIGMGTVLFSFVSADSLNYRSITSLLWIFSGAILLLDREWASPRSGESDVLT